MNTHERPINLDLTQFSFPLPALASITHRITGVILF
ncbi:MAG: succinate dehydrogenase, cytochrome b556 subunit, partial [Pseudomonadota bacterium]|nr:succinate dehydrogenase, cytochrome b556 subunit [Pseudomonadota bacterium]